MPVDQELDNAHLIVRRVLTVDLRAASEMFRTQLEKRNKAVDVDEIHAVVQAALEDTQRVLVVGAYHENQPGFAHGKLVGVLMMNVITSVEHAGEVGWIETLYVRDAYRRRGLAERLLEQALTWSRARGLRRLEVEVSEEHEVGPAEALYRKHGFALVRSARMSRDLSHEA